MILLAAMLMANPMPAPEAEGPHAYFASDRTAVVERITAACVADGRDVDRKDDREVVCSKPVAGLKGAWLKFGPNHGSFDETSRQRLTFMLHGSSAMTFVDARRDVGPGHKHQAWDHEATTTAQTLLERAGGLISPERAAALGDNQLRTTGRLIVPTVRSQGD